MVSYINFPFRVTYDMSKFLGGVILIVAKQESLLT